MLLCFLSDESAHMHDLFTINGLQSAWFLDSKKSSHDSELQGQEEAGCTRMNKWVIYT